MKFKKMLSLSIASIVLLSTAACTINSGSSIVGSNATSTTINTTTNNKITTPSASSRTSTPSATSTPSGSSRTSTSSATSKPSVSSTTSTPSATSKPSASNTTSTPTGTSSTDRPGDIEYPVNQEYLDLLAKGNLIYYNDFNSDNVVPTKWSESWGTKGLYSYAHPKNASDVVNEDNHKITNTKGALQLNDTDDNGTQLILDFGQELTGKVDGCVDITFIGGGSSWTFMQFQGTSSGKMNSEVFALRTNKTNLVYRLDGGSELTPTGTVSYTATSNFKLYFSFDLDSNTVTIRINDIEFLTDFTLSNNITSISGIKFVSSDKGSKTLNIDDLVVRNESYSLSELKTKTINDLNTAYTSYEIEAKYPSVLEETNAILAKAITDINASQVKANIPVIYNNAIKEIDSKIITLVKNDAISELDSYVDLKKYTTNKAEVENTLFSGKKEINASTTVSTINEILASYKSKLDAIKTDDELETALVAYQSTKSLELEKLVSDYEATYTNEALKTALDELLANGKALLLDGATIDEVDVLYNKALKAITEKVEEYCLENNIINIIEAKGDLETAYIEWQKIESAELYAVYYKLSSEADNKYKKIDDTLIREYPDNMRADIVGLKAGDYQIKLVAISNNVETATVYANASVMAHNRDGYSHFNKTDGVGAYNNDGTLKSNAEVLYLYQDNINTCTLNINGTTYTGIKDITQAIKKKNSTNPIAIRIIGKVDAGADGTGLSCQDFKSAYALGVKEADSVTFEGIGEDAILYNCGIAAFKSSNIEVRNIGFINWGGGKDGDGISLKESDHVWVHNNDIFYGNAGSDGDQAKGDGSMDLKDDSQYITISYNHFWDSGKMSLCGMKSESGDNWITYHHNWFDHSDSRHPRIRVMTVHVYNNYYDGNSKYGMATAMGGTAFSEANYFRNCPKPYLIGSQGTEAGAVLSGEKGNVIKAYNDYFEGTSTYIPYTSNCGTNFDVYVAKTRDEKVDSSVKTIGGYSYNNFDTDPSKIYSYTADDPLTAKQNVITYSGRINGGDFSWTFNNSVEDTSYSLNNELKAALNNYKSKLIAIQGVK